MPTISKKVPDKKSARTPEGIGAIVKWSSRTIPATGRTATDVSLNFDKSSRIKEGYRPSVLELYNIIVTYVMVLCQFGILYEIFHAKKVIIHKT